MPKNKKQKLSATRHKKTGGEEDPEDRPMVVGDKCTRCLETVEADEDGHPVLTGCNVPHPEHLQTDIVSFYGKDGMEYTLACPVCNSGYTRKTAFLEIPKSEVPITNGPKFCYQGSHTLLPVEQLGECRVKQDVVVIRAHKDMQQEIDALDGNKDVTVLRICSQGFYDRKSQPCLNVKLPNLREVQFNNVVMKQIHLTPELTPNVEIITMQSPSDELDPDFDIKCNKLKHFQCYHWGWGDNPDWANIMLQHATQLESFDSYKFRVPHLIFASNHLTRIRLDRAECLNYLGLYAPRLTSLQIHGCHDLGEIQFFESAHPKLPKPSGSFDQELKIRATNAVLGRTARSAIRNHGRFHGELKVDNEDAAYALVTGD